MDLNERNSDREKRISEYDAGMGKGCRVKENEIDILFTSIVDALEELMLGVALEAGQLVSPFLGQLFEVCLD